MSEIDPMVHDLADVVQSQVLAGQEGDDDRFGQCSRKWDELAQRLTARLAQPTVTRAQIEAVLLSELARTTTIAAITDAVMAVIAPDTAGGVGDGQGN